MTGTGMSGEHAAMPFVQAVSARSCGEFPMRNAIHTAKRLFLAVLGGGLLLPLAIHAEDSVPVQAGWKTQEIRYSYVGFTTAYDCDAAEYRIKAILRALGAHPQTRVAAQG